MSSSNGFDYGKQQPLGPRPSQLPQDRGQKDFLKYPLPELSSNRWQGVKILGVGGFGTVGLWKRRVPKADTPSYIAVKTTNFLPDEYGNEGIYFGNEAKWHSLLNTAKSQHIVGLILKPKEIQSEDGLHVERLYTEYCPMGSLRDLLVRRAKLAKPFAESTLWLFLNCMVDGLSVLAYGQECAYDEWNQTAQATKKEGWSEICHNDLHASNFFLGEFNTSHAFTPVVKVADFGESAEINLEQWDNQEFAEEKAEASNFPELQGARYDFKNWDKLGTTTKSNIWHAGLVMGWLAILEPGIVSHTEYNPGQNDLKGWTPRGTTHTENLRHTPYSSALKRIIFECLYKDPAHRPDLLTLKEQVQEGWRAAIKAAPEGEPWADFVHPDPDGPDWDPDTWDPNDDDNTDGNNGATGYDGGDDAGEEDDEGSDEDEDEEEEDEEEDEEDDGEQTEGEETHESAVIDTTGCGNDQGEGTGNPETEADGNDGNIALIEQGRKSRCRIQ